MTTLTKQEAADYMRISISLFKKIQNAIPCIKLGRRVLYDKKDLDTYLENVKNEHLN